MSNEFNLIHELEKVAFYLHGAHSACDHENSSATFHQVKHLIDDIINKVKNSIVIR